MAFIALVIAATMTLPVAAGSFQKPDELVARFQNVIQQTAPVMPPDVFGTWQEAGSDNMVTVSRRGAGVVGMTGAGQHDGAYGMNEPYATRKLVACIDWTYERSASASLSTLTLRQTATRRPGCRHGRPTMNTGESANTPATGTSSGDHGADSTTETELVLSVADGVLTVETRVVAPDGPVTVSTKKYRRR